MDGQASHTDTCHRETPSFTLNVPLQLAANFLIHLLIYFSLVGQIYIPLNYRSDCQIVDLFVNLFLAWLESKFLSRPIDSIFIE